MKSSSPSMTLLCLSLLALAACGKGKEQGPPQMPPPEVGVIRIQPQSSPLTKDLVGRLSPYRSADVRARVAGVLLKRAYTEGTDVKQGQLLFQIDPAPLKAALSAAEASLAQAQATYTNAKVNAQRARELAPKGYISKSDLDNAQASERSAAAAVQAARANVQTARISLGYASVTSPIEGRAGQQQVTEGALVGNGGDATLLTTVDQIDPLYVNFTMSVADLEQMRRAQSNGNVTLAEPDKASVQVALPDGSAYAEAGTLDFSSTTVDPATGAVNLRAQIPNPKHSLLPGMYVTLKAQLGEQHKVFLVPQEAVLRDTVGAYVFTVGKDGKVARRDVATSAASGGNWVVTAGLAAGEQVIVSGVQNVKEGEPAKASPWQPSTAGNRGSAAAASAPARGK
ncbi:MULTISPECIES: efflux RND transporter periplasmic adaptor subunit [unclassified Rhodanobacter]|uniref:efflux RND transporter periplasmic adaptor subunit n=1 Tax=unclassified Rhodanobacter TaxID=2621553 RepID=UPI001BDF5820|nr:MULTISPECIES: efflux RND transporter periplasmic adaptor subunit [unclassified Rhodanobacter]MBT2142944.1 efflux RND transporter periplasmic adaptor subunit [Rhodanobacter sp. LX-99]MBT2147983.1 efflux RND transporter periplasmic adaptor subunit [Rhodanobacter sp. LX-100]